MFSAWANEEAASVKLGDERLDGRMAIVLSALGNRPTLSIPAACGGRAEMQAAYRFFDNDKVTFAKVLAPHYERTLQRLAGHEVVLLVQDTTEIDLTRPQQEVVGAGDLDGSRRGVFLHLMHAFTPDGTPLGTVWADCLNRTEPAPVETAGEKRQRLRRTPIEQKESMRWLTGLREARKVAAKLPQAQCICVNDSEADIYELFAEPRGESDASAVHWLIRACHDRTVTDEPSGSSHLREQVMNAAVLYELDLRIRQRESMTTVEKRARRLSRPARQAHVQVRAATVTLRPPRREDRALPAVTVNVVLVSEPNPPAGEEAVEWILVTTLPIETPEQARLVVEYYCVRWNIEILFRTLKSGCRIEWRRFEHVDRISRCLALYLIVAWRTLFVCRMGRECPDADCETLFEPCEWKAVWVAVHRKEPPAKKPRLSEMVHLVATLGGYIERPKSEPGPQTVWTGLQRMYDLAWAWETFGPHAKIGKA
jgi:hypothetical protein